MSRLSAQLKPVFSVVYRRDLLRRDLIYLGILASLQNSSITRSFSFSIWPYLSPPIIDAKLPMVKDRNTILKVIQIIARILSYKVLAVISP